MTNSAASTRATRSSKPRHVLKPWMLYVSAVVLVLAVIGGYFANKYWPYRYRNVEPLLENVFASKITIEKYHRIYFPSPGFVATGLTLRRNSAPDLPPVGSARNLIVRGSWLDLLTLRDRVQLVDVVGLQIVIPPVGSHANKEDFPPGSSADFAGPTTAVEELHLHDAELDILRTNGGRYVFPIKQLVIRNLQKGKTISYSVDMQNAQPRGHILSKGTFGPLVPNNLGATPLSGDFTFTEVQLHDIGGIHGVLSASDHFQGVLAAIEANVRSNTPDFAVGRGRPTVMSAAIRCAINGLNGDVVLHSIEAKIGMTTVRVEGSIAGSPKAANLNIAVVDGRVQDLMQPFLHDKVPVAGAVWIDSHAQLLPAKNGSKFLQRLRMEGSFNVPAERLTKRATEQKLSAFSQRAQGNSSTKSDGAVGDQGGDSSTDVLSSLDGSVTMRDGIFSTQRLTFKLPGAQADFNGTYNLNDKTVHMVGNLAMQSDISHVTTGFKSMLLKPFSPFFKKGKAGAVIPVAITGTSGNYKITEDLGHRK